MFLYNCTSLQVRDFRFMLAAFMILLPFLQSASHLPYNRNGFKFFTDAGGLGKVDIKDILERAAEIYKNFTDEGLREAEKRAAQSVKRVDYMSVYISDLVAAVRKAAGDRGIPLYADPCDIRVTCMENGNIEVECD